jgi:hypothetical protein
MNVQDTESQWGDVNIESCSRGQGERGAQINCHLIKPLVSTKSLE